MLTHCPQALLALDASFNMNTSEMPFVTSRAPNDDVSSIFSGFSNAAFVNLFSTCSSVLSITVPDDCTVAALAQTVLALFIRAGVCSEEDVLLVAGVLPGST